MFATIVKKVFGSKSARDVKRLRPLVAKINALEESYQSLTEEQLKAKTQEFKDRYAKGESLDSMMCEAFAVVKNACRRMVGRTYQVCGHDLVWDMIPFDVQIIGGIVLHQGKIAEMATGEGKTLVATMPLYLNALSGRNCQLVTVNDYLALRDSQWVGRVFEYLGLTVGCIQNSMHSAQRKAQYACDITYGTNSEFGFDYLRDMGMATDKDHLVQRDYFYVIIDEVDSILIDEARTPLIISGPVSVSTHQFDKLQPLVASLYRKQESLCTRLLQEAKAVIDRRDEGKATEEEFDEAIRKLLQVKFGMPRHKLLAHILEDADILKRLERYESFVRSDQNRGMLQEVQEDLYFSMDEKQHEADLTERGRNTVSPNDPDAFVLPDLLNALHDIDNDPSTDYRTKLMRHKAFQEAFAEKSERLQNLSQLLRAYCLFEKDVDYVVMEGKVLIVDEHTGRILPGRRFSDGLHQALEAKENVKIESETQTLATITIQNYFRMYQKLAGMTGTAETEANEFHQIYKLDVVVIPTNRPCIRKDVNDTVFKTKREKFRAIVAETEAAYKRGQPVLLGTISVEDSELVSRMLRMKNIPHNVLNAKNHARESEIVALAGRRGSVTVATNMAGRGTDIKLEPGVEELGGLLVLGSSRHDSRRIDRQLRGRCGRQGDPGMSHFYVSLEDNLMRLFGSDRIVTIMEKFGMEEGEELQHPLLSRSIETAQRRVEQHHFSIRKRTLEYDDVMNKQREVIYGFRHDTLFQDDSRQAIFDIIEIEVGRHVEEAFAATTGDQKITYNRDMLLAWLNYSFPFGFTEEDIAVDLQDEKASELMVERILKKVHDMYELKASLEDPVALKWLERQIVLDAIDSRWQEHLRSMDELRGSIGLRAYAQKDPLVEYKREAFRLFEQLMNDIDQQIIGKIFRSATSLAAFERFVPAARQYRMSHQTIDDLGTSAAAAPAEASITVNAAPQETSPSIDASSPESVAPRPDPGIPYQRGDQRVGPNDPCPCGSGKKFKKCCGQ
ncbi:MAG: preprotein translocase subunit SecA [Lentisphaeria bacterium]|nr:preprotein translocase subunit SecA [Lentisphaeria bacterium]